MEIQRTIGTNPVISVVIDISTGNADRSARRTDPGLLITIDTAVIDIDDAAFPAPDPMSAACAASTIP